MVQNSRFETLFRLVPRSPDAHAALSAPENKSFVSPTGNFNLGLEIGFHVPKQSSGRVITRIGRQADLILYKSNISGVHIAFEIHPTTLLVVLVVRARRPGTVIVAPIDEEPYENDGTSGDRVIPYGRNFRIAFSSYSFELHWRQWLGDIDCNANILRELTIAQYNLSIEATKNQDFLAVPTVEDAADLQSFYNTRIHSAAKQVVVEMPDQRKHIGSGGFGAVYRTVDKLSGQPFAVKVLKIMGRREDDRLREIASIHNEIKALEFIQHEHIVEYLGCKGWDANETQSVDIYMPLRDGTLSNLIQNPRCNIDWVCRTVLHQMLQALDYLACKDLCHRDLKPDNILYTRISSGNYRFQLADFGLAKFTNKAKTCCGTAFYMAPEIRREADGRSPKTQTPVVDIWSLFISIVNIHPEIPFPPRRAKTLEDILPSVERIADSLPHLKPMAEYDGRNRASAAELLLSLFGGSGMSTKERHIRYPLPVYENWGFQEVQSQREDEHHRRHRNDHENVRRTRYQDREARNDRDGDVVMRDVLEHHDASHQSARYAMRNRQLPRGASMVEVNPDSRFR